MRSTVEFIKSLALVLVFASVIRYFFAGFASLTNPLYWICAVSTAVLFELFIRMIL